MAQVPVIIAAPRAVTMVVPITVGGSIDLDMVFTVRAEDFMVDRTTDADSIGNTAIGSKSYGRLFLASELACSPRSVEEVMAASAQSKPVGPAPYIKGTPD